VRAIRIAVPSARLARGVMSSSFPLAPMTRDVRVMTLVALCVPVGLVLVAMATRTVPLVVPGLIALLYASVWLFWRPTRFEVDDGALRIVWPLRTRVIDRAAIETVRVVAACDLRPEYGAGMRIGVGGLWGGFGLLKTRRTTFSMWISRTDRLVVVELRGARPLLVTPDDPERFVEAVRA
jgi:hypothetical protein